MSKDDRFAECDLHGMVYDEAGTLVKTRKRSIADVLNEFHDRLCEIEGALEREENYKQEQRER